MLRCLLRLCYERFFAARFFLTGPRSRRSLSSSAARSGVIDSTESPALRLAFVSPSVTYGPKRPSFRTTGCLLTGSSPSSLSGGGAAPGPRRLRVPRLAGGAAGGAGDHPPP